MAYTVNLTHRGPQVIECIDLFDEARYGADKLFFRGRFNTADEVKSQVAISLGNISLLDADKIKEIYGVDLSSETTTEEEKESLKLKLGIGNPLLEGDDVPTIALNRYHIPNKKFWNNTPPSDVENPYKASAAVKFSIRVHFRDDYAYIDFGCPWELVEDGKLTSSSDAEEFTKNFVLLHCHFISKEDALQIIDSIFPKTSDNTATYAIMRNAPKIITETTELVDEDGTIISL
jgi:hypothetical protein